MRHLLAMELLTEDSSSGGALRLERGGGGGGGSSSGGGGSSSWGLFVVGNSRLRERLERLYLYLQI